MKKTLSAVLALLLVLSMCFMAVGCGGSNDGGDAAGGDAAQEVVLHFGSTQGTSHAWYEAANKFAENVAASNTGLTIQVDFGGVWGSDKEHAEAVQNGTLDMYLGSTVGFDAIVTKIGFVNLPYVVTTYDEVDSLIYNGWMGETIKADAEEAGFKILGITDCDFRWLSNSKNPIESAADIKGLKMRVPEAPMFLEFFENLGAVPTAMAFTEVPSALQQKTIDGQDNGPTLSYPNGLHQFNQYWTKSNHSFASAVIAMNPAKFDTLSAEQQAALQSAVDQLVIDVKDLLREDVGEMTQGMIDAGCDVIDPTDQLQADMQEAAQKVWNSEAATGNYDQDAVAKIRSEA
ncbi:MAG: TRAP transporter substrate-binding protein [Anaerovoracaceae bacterium]